MNDLPVLDLTGRIDPFWALNDPQALIQAAVPRADLMATIGTDPLDEPNAIDPTTIVGNVAIINVEGLLLKRPGFWRYFGLGGATLPEIESAFQRAESDSRIDTILMRSSTPGGTVAGLESTGDAVFAARSSKRTIAFVEDLSASAGYWLASQCEEVATHSTGQVGGIGIYTAITDASKWFTERGLEVFLATSGGVKGQGTYGTELSPEFREYMTALVGDLAAVFDAAVARGRSIDVSAAQSLRDGRTHVGQKSVDAGLADRVISFRALLAELTGEDRTQVPVQSPSEPESEDDEEQAKETVMPEETNSPPAAPAAPKPKASDPAEELRAQYEAELAVLRRDSAARSVDTALAAMGTRLTPGVHRAGTADRGALAAALTELRLSGVKVTVKAGDVGEQSVLVADVVTGALGALPSFAVDSAEFADAHQAGDTTVPTAELAAASQDGLNAEEVARLQAKYPGSYQGNVN